MLEPLTGEEVRELEEIEEFLRSKMWRVIRKVTSEYRIRCVERVHTHLRKHEDRKAGEELAKSGIYNVLATLIQNRKDELSNRK